MDGTGKADGLGEEWVAQRVSGGAVRRRRGAVGCAGARRGAALLAAALQAWRSGRLGAYTTQPGSTMVDNSTLFNMYMRPNDPAIISKAMPSKPKMNPESKSLGLITWLGDCRIMIMGVVYLWFWGLRVVGQETI